MSVGQRVCCPCPEPDDYDAEIDGPLPKYKTRCACLAVEITYESAQKQATLCGYKEFTDPPIGNSPPNYYLTLSTTRTGTRRRYASFFRCSYEARLRHLVSYSGGSTRTWSLPTCTLSAWTGTADHDYTYYVYGLGCIQSVDGSGTLPYNVWETDPDIVDSPTVGRILDEPDGLDEDGVGETGTLTDTITLSNPDSELAALGRVTATTGTAATSIYQLRTTVASFTHRTVEYTATAKNLVPGVAYKGCIRLQRREAYSGTEPDDADTETWIDVEPDTIDTFTAADTEEIVGEDIELPIEQGWEYRIASAHIYPANSDCACPSTYEEPPE